MYFDILTYFLGCGRRLNIRDPYQHAAQQQKREVASTETSPSKAGLAGMKRHISFARLQKPRVAVKAPAIAAKPDGECSVGPGQQ